MPNKALQRGGGQKAAPAMKSSEAAGR